MNSVGFSTMYARSWGFQTPEGVGDVLRDSSYCLTAIPPERIGLNGEYDHYGLVKRVHKALTTHLPIEALQSLRISQRGGVVVLKGNLPDRQILDQVVNIALNVMGTFAVESYGVKCGNL
jgi:hypothetical protein